MPLLGSDVQDPNFTLRFCLITFIGVIGFGFTIIWKSTLIVAAEYQDMPVTQQDIRIKKENAEIKKELSQKKNIKNKIINQYDSEY